MGIQPSEKLEMTQNEMNEEVNENVEQMVVPSENERKALIWRCMAADNVNQKTYGSGCGKFSVLWTTLRSGNSKKRFLGRCKHCKKTSALNPETGNIILWMDSRTEAIEAAEQFNSAGLV
tara:strand:- start:64 stop:423 length:360 start_codon:yes stop_codon:yes gene_type:complete